MIPRKSPSSSATYWEKNRVLGIIKTRLAEPKPKSTPFENALAEIRQAAFDGKLSKLPAPTKRYLNLKTMGLCNSLGMNMLHTAAAGGNLDKVPKVLIDPKLCLEKDNNKMNVLHHAASSNQLDYIPKEAINIKSLSAKDGEGYSVYHYLSNYGGLKKLKEELISQKELLKDNTWGRDCLDMALNPDIDPKFKDHAKVKKKITQETLHCLSIESLKTIISECREVKPGYSTPRFPDQKDKKKTCQEELKRKCIFKIINSKQANTLEI